MRSRRERMEAQGENGWRHCWKSLLGPVVAELGKRKGHGILEMLHTGMVQVFSEVCPLYFTLHCSAVAGTDETAYYRTHAGCSS